MPNWRGSWTPGCGSDCLLHFADRFQDVFRPQAAKREQIAELWEVDGSLRDVYAAQMTMERWRAFLSFAQQVEGRYASDGEPSVVPDAGTIFLLALLIEGVQINCHFFAEDELELDIDPREVETAGAHEAVLRFLEAVATAIQLPLDITPENIKSRPYLSYDLEGANWTWHD